MDIFKDRIDEVYEVNIKPMMRQIVEMKQRGLEDRHIAKALGITVKEFSGALNRYKDFAMVYNDATLLLISKLTNVVVARALGEDGRVDKDGNLIPADEKLAFEVLKKIDPRFKERSEKQITFTIETVIKEIERERKKALEEALEEEDDYIEVEIDE